MHLTHQTLADAPCRPEQVEAFRAAFPDGLNAEGELTPETRQRILNAGLDLYWLTRCVPFAARVDYMAATASPMNQRQIAAVRARRMLRGELLAIDAAVDWSRVQYNDDYERAIEPALARFLTAEQKAICECNRQVIDHWWAALQTP